MTWTGSAFRWSPGSPPIPTGTTCSGIPGSATCRATPPPAAPRLPVKRGHDVGALVAEEFGHLLHLGRLGLLPGAVSLGLLPGAVSLSVDAFAPGLPGRVELDRGRVDSLRLVVLHGRDQPVVQSFELVLALVPEHNRVGVRGG